MFASKVHASKDRRHWLRVEAMVEGVGPLHVVAILRLRDLLVPHAAAFASLALAFLPSLHSFPAILAYSLVPCTQHVACEVEAYEVAGEAASVVAAAGERPQEPGSSPVTAQPGPFSGSVDWHNNKRSHGGIGACTDRYRWIECIHNPSSV